MDPISQGLVGGLASQTVSRSEDLRTAAIMGWLAGMAPDLDVLIVSPSDPLLFLEHHRGFTHSLLFIPVGALLCATCFYWLTRRRHAFKQIYLWCFMGYGIHGLLDACTTYGTQLFWPLTDWRLAFNNISVVDPLLTVPALMLFAVAWVRRSRDTMWIAVIWIGAYLALGVVQRERAEAIGYALAAQTGVTPTRLEAKPGFGNLLLWKIIYEADGTFYVAGARLGFDAWVIPGGQIRKLDVTRDLPFLELTSTHAVDIERFRWFSNDYLAVDPKDPLYIVDMRYSMLPNDINAMWGIDLDPERQQAHVVYRTRRTFTDEQSQRLIRWLTGDIGDDGYPVRELVTPIPAGSKVGPLEPIP